MLLTWKSAHILAWSNKVYTLILLLLFKASLRRGECCLCRWSLFCQWCWSLWLSFFPFHSALIFPGFLSRLDMTFQKNSNYSDSKKDQNLPGVIGNEGWAQRTLRVVEGSCVITGDNSDRCTWVQHQGWTAMQTVSVSDNDVSSAKTNAYCLHWRRQVMMYAGGIWEGSVGTLKSLSSVIYKIVSPWKWS